MPDPENIMLSERSQMPKAAYCMTPFTGSVQNRPVHRDGKQIGHFQGLGGAGRKWEAAGFFLG